MIRVYFLVIATLVFVSCQAQREEQEYRQHTSTVNRINADNDSLRMNLDSMRVSYQFRGSCYAYSSEKYAIPSNGEAHSSNLAHPTDSTFSADSLYLYLNTQELTAYGDTFLGHTLYLVNNTNQPVSFRGQDSRLDIVAEALDESGKWQPISYLPSSWCGNSYHNITLGNGEYWSFKVPVFTGDYKTKLRYVLLSGKTKPPLVSNEIDVLIRLNQFDQEQKEGHRPNGLMDPYRD